MSGKHPEASNPDNWRVVCDKPMPAGLDREADIATAEIDKQMIRLLEMTPDSLSWRMVELCEGIISPATNSSDHIDAVAEIVRLVPQVFYVDALNASKLLMKAAGRYVVSSARPRSAEVRLAVHYGHVRV